MDKQADVVRERELDRPSREHSLERLLDRLLAVEPDNRVRRLRVAQRPSGRLIVAGYSEQLLSEISLVRHQPASTRPSPNAECTMLP